MDWDQADADGRLSMTRALLASRHFTQNRYPLLLNVLLVAEFYR